MSISESSVQAGHEATAAAAAIEGPNYAIPTLPEPGSRNRKSHRAISDSELTLLQICCDFICATIALPLSLVVLSWFSTAHVNDYDRLWTNLELDSFFPVAVVIALAIGGIYRVSNRRLQPSAFLEMRELAFGVGCGMVLAIAVGAFFHGAVRAPEPLATQLVMAVIVTVAIITLGRMVMRYFLRALTTTRVLVVGAGTAADRIMLSVRQDPGMTLVGRVVDGDLLDPGTLGRVGDLPHLCCELGVHRILVAARDSFSMEALDTYRELQGFVHIAMVPRYYELISWRSRLVDLSGMPFLEIAQPHLSPWDQFLKRAFDIAFSSVILLVASPLLLVVAAGVKFSSPGPVFFRQERLGRRQEPFTVIKFRSMTVGTERDVTDEPEPHLENADVPLHQLRRKMDESARITRFGAFLRKTGIDEIPQFINVFKGDMSVVGPRPFVPRESKVDGWATRRFDVRPGITGLWQVSGRNDLSRNDLVQLDYLYVASWSLWWDLKIVFETPKAMARGTGAY